MVSVDVKQHVYLPDTRDTTCGHKAKGITPSIAWRREAWEEEALDERTREGHRLSETSIGTLENAHFSCQTPKQPRCETGEHYVFR